MDKIRIYHAYSGFLYAPLLLADRLGLFPRNTELVYTASDEKTISELCAHSMNSGGYSFAVCDPFSIDLNSALETSDDDLCVIASLANVIPLWVFNPNRSIKPVNQESELSKLSNHIARIISYPKDTTGYLVATRVRTAVGAGALTEVNFGQEFASAPLASDLVVTADVLRLVHEGLGKDNIVFNYATKSPPELKPFLFTGILTLRSSITEDLWAVLAVLGAIRSALERLDLASSQSSYERARDLDVKQEYIDFLIDIYSHAPTGDVFPPLGLTTSDQKRHVVRSALKFLRDQEIYASFPRPRDDRDWETAWNNARGEWKRQKQRECPAVEQKHDPFPSLLVRRKWREHLASYVPQLFPELGRTPAVPPGVSRQFFDWKQKAILGVGWVLLGFCALALFTIHWYTFEAPLPNTTDHIGGLCFGWASGLFIFESLGFIALRRTVYAFRDPSFEWALWGLPATGFLAIVNNLVTNLKR